MPLQNVRSFQGTAVIANGGTTSNPIRVGGEFTRGNVVIPNMTTAVTLALEVSADGATYVALGLAEEGATTSYDALPETRTLPLPSSVFSFHSFRFVANAAVGAAATIVVRMY